MSTRKFTGKPRHWSRALLLSTGAWLGCGDSESPTNEPLSPTVVAAPVNTSAMGTTGMVPTPMQEGTAGGPVNAPPDPEATAASGMNLPMGGGMATAPMGGSPVDSGGPDMNADSMPAMDPMTDLAAADMDGGIMDMPAGNGEETSDDTTPLDPMTDPDSDAMDSTTDEATAMAGTMTDPMTGEDGTGDTPDETDMAEEPMARRPPCVDPDEVAIIGDSYINYDVTHTFLADLAEVAGVTWPNYAEAGAAMATGGLVEKKIPEQFESAVAAQDTIKAVVMDGGGNDILIPDLMWRGGGECKNNPAADTVQVCQDIVQTSIDRTKELRERMAAAGVEDTVFFFYPHTPGGGLFNAGGSNPNVILDYSLPLAKEACESAEMQTDGKLRCYFVDTRPLFEGKRNVFASDGIHPNENGSRLIAEAVWQTMQEHCIGQPESSGCCEPQQSP